MNSLIPIFIFGSVSFCIYKIFELFVRRNERMAIIEKMQFNIPESITSNLNLPIFTLSKQSSYWPLRLGLLLVGIGIGVFIGFIFEITMLPDSLKPEFVNYDHNVRRNILDTTSMIYLASVAIFGGIGLLIAYFVEQKEEKEAVSNNV